MALKGKIPQKENLRLKAFLYGPAGVGKTLAAVQFPNSYIIDTAKETSRYSKIIQDNGSVVFECSDPFEILNELHELRVTKHNFQTLVIDEVTTVYQNLQRDWIDRFVDAAEGTMKNAKAVLLQDFGIRYWDKVKRDWRRIVDAARNLDMNVIFTAHQKDKYGPNQTVIGITSDSEKNDEYIFDFVFRLIIKGKEYKAITEKQRVLPKEIDPESRQFPKEFSWDYDTIIKFYNKEYLEGSTKNTNKILEGRKVNEITVYTANSKNKNSIIDENKIKEIANEAVEKVRKEANEAIEEYNKEEDILKIKKLLKNNNIKASQFKDFLRVQCKWNHVNKLNDLHSEEIVIILDKWSKVYKKYCLYKSQSTDENKNTNINSDYKKTALLNVEQDKPIREDQKQYLLDLLSSKGITTEKLLSGFGLREFSEISQGGAVNMINNFDVFIQAF